MTDKIVVLSTCETELEAVKIARHLVDKRVAACVNITSNVRSIYRWKDSAGKDTIEDAIEYLRENPSAGGFSYTIGDRAGRIVIVEAAAGRHAWAASGAGRYSDSDYA